jgi:hypothetical protein
MLAEVPVAAAITPNAPLCAPWPLGPSGLFCAIAAKENKHKDIARNFI